MEVKGGVWSKMSDIESENIANVEGREDDEQDVDDRDRFNLLFSITVAKIGTKEIDNDWI